MKHFSMKYAILLGCIALLSSCGNNQLEQESIHYETHNSQENSEESETQEEPSEPTAATVVEWACNTAGELTQSSNSEIETMRQALVNFRSSLSDDLLEEASTCLDNERLYLWHNTPANDRGARDGIQYQDLDDTQLESFKTILSLFLSNDGYKKVNDITVLSEGWLEDIMPDSWNPGFYYIDMFGNPETSGSWGFQLDWHHAAITFIVHGDNVSMVPAFLWGEPGKGEFDGESFDIFAQERDLWVELYNSLSETESTSAEVGTQSDSNSLQVGPADRAGDIDPYIGDYNYSEYATGLKYSDMSAEAKANLETVMKEYVYNLTGSFADVWWDDIEANIDDTYFAWIDGVDTPDSESKFYYRIYNPYVWIEFNTEDVTGANANNIDDWNHVHSITRVPSTGLSGGDYSIFANIINNAGPKMLSDHYAMADHHNY